MEAMSPIGLHHYQGNMSLIIAKVLISVLAASDPASPGEIATSTPAITSRRPASRQVIYEITIMRSH